MPSHASPIYKHVSSRFFNWTAPFAFFPLKHKRIAHDFLVGLLSFFLVTPCTRFLDGHLSFFLLEYFVGVNPKNCTSHCYA